MSSENISGRAVGLDTWSSGDVVAAMIEGQLAAVASIAALRDPMAAAVDAATACLERGGRLCYAGAGTSGRLAVLDGVELTPTFDWPADRLVYFLAGDLRAMTVSVEGAEDDADAARSAVAAAGLGPADVLIGVAASGHTPYTVAAVEEATRAGSLTIAVSADADTPLAAAARHPLVAPTAPELIAGSTRMKAGTAQKAILNSLSSAIMVRLGHVHDGHMVSVRPTNDKLRRRAVAMVTSVAGCEPAVAHERLVMSGWRVKTAVMMIKAELDAEAAEAALLRAGGHLRAALREVGAER